MAVSLKERAYDHILGKLLGGGMPPGTKLSDIHLAKEIGISRTPVREAIIQMESQGLVEQVSGVGPRVKSLDRQDLDETFELREMLETAAVGKAVTRITDVELRELQSLTDQYLATVRRLRDVNHQIGTAQIFDRLVVLDMAFHLMLVRAAKNRRLVRIMGDLHVLSRILKRRAELPGVNTLTRSALVWRDHTRIVRAMWRRDVAAAQTWMSRHIQRARRHHLDAFDWYQRQLGAGRAGERDLPEHLLRMLSGMESDEQAGPAGAPTDSKRRARSRRPHGRSDGDK
jgi:DNA-binding GntR family transcriptional regulator